MGRLAPLQEAYQAMPKQSIANRLVHAWYEKSAWLWLLAPISLLFGLLSLVRRWWLKKAWSRRPSDLVPVVVVGNITVGGAGKSPLVAYLVRSFEQQGLRAGIVSRGYGAETSIQQPILLTDQSTAAEVGDEPLMLFQQLACPVCVSPNRGEAVAHLSKLGCDIIISDDGLQHYAMQRDIEICVFDAQRLWGNGWLLPAGPLREPLSRLKEVDFVIFNGGDAPSQEVLTNIESSRCLRMDLAPQELQSLDGTSSFSLDALRNRSISAVAGIGNPERFFRTLESLGARVTSYSFGDHHAYQIADFEPILSSMSDSMIVMTQKDAVKCRNIAIEKAWYLPVSAQLSDNLAQKIISQLHSQGRLLPSSETKLAASNTANTYHDTRLDS